MRLGSSLRRRRRQGVSGGDSTDGRGPALSPRGRATLVSAGVAVVGLGIGYLLATQLLFPAPPPPGELVTVPDVRGRALDGAREALSGTGLEVQELDELRHPSADSGSVVGQAPLPGQLTAPGRTVRLTVSLGPERRRVPDVVRLRHDRALGLLEATGLRVMVDSVESDLPRGRVVAVSPAAGTEIQLPGEVALTVSLGPPMVVVPSLRGLTEDAARDSLQALGLEVSEVREVFRFGRDQGRVVSQEPPADTEIGRGGSVRLVVGRRGG